MLGVIFSAVLGGIVGGIVAAWLMSVFDPTGR
jgi:hypothetical protein